jgi:hypothetical protein
LQGFKATVVKKKKFFVALIPDVGRHLPHRLGEAEADFDGLVEDRKREQSGRKDFKVQSLIVFT